jgi:hypothetical protein
VGGTHRAWAGLVSTAWIAAILIAAALAGSGHAATTGVQFGVYAGGGNPSRAAAFGSWLGKPPTLVLDYLEWENWTDIAQTTWALDAWESEPYHLVLSVPMLPADGSSLANGAAGDYDHHFVELGRNLVARGLGNSTIRLGWEFNLPHFPWYAGADTALFVVYWRSIVDAMRSVDGAAFTFDWSANLGSGGFALEDAYPGDAFVDTIGLDVYNHDWDAGWENSRTRWQNLLTKNYGLEWHRQFADGRGKRTSFPEWGMIVRSDGHGGGDDAYFIEQMHDWINSGNTGFQMYFDLDTHESQNSMTMGLFPAGAARFRELFGPPSIPPPVVPPVAVVPPGAVAPPAGARLLPVLPAARVVGERAPSVTTPGQVRAVVRRSRQQLRIAVGIRRPPAVRRIDVLLDGRRVCRDRHPRFRCHIRSLSPGRYDLLVRVHDTRREKIALERTLKVGGGYRKKIVLRTPSRDVAR